MLLFIRFYEYETSNFLIIKKRRYLYVASSLTVSNHSKGSVICQQEIKKRKCLTDIQTDDKLTDINEYKSDEKFGRDYEAGMQT